MRPNNKQRSSGSPNRNITSDRIGRYWAWLLVWQVPLLSQLVSPGGRLIVADYNRCSKFPGTPTTPREGVERSWESEAKFAGNVACTKLAFGRIAIERRAGRFLANTRRRYCRDLIRILNDADLVLCPSPSGNVDRTCGTTCGCCGAQGLRRIGTSKMLNMYMCPKLPETLIQSRATRHSW